MNKAIKNLSAGDLFTRNGNPTVYRCERVRSEAAVTVVTYSVPGDRDVTPTRPWSFHAPSLSTAKVVL